MSRIVLYPVRSGGILRKSFISEVGDKHGNNFIDKRGPGNELIVGVDCKPMGQTLNSLHNDEAGVFRYALSCLWKETKKSSHGFSSVSF